MRTAFWVIAAGVLALALAGAGWGTAHRAAAADDRPAERAEFPPFTGTRCTVYLRGDASGAAIHDRLPELANLIHRSGTIVAADDHWLRLTSTDGRHYRIPVAAVLAIEYGEEKK